MVKSRPLRLGEQDAAMRLLWPTFQRTLWKQNKITWSGPLQPADLCALYTIRIDYSLEMGAPDVRVIAPPLRRRGAEDIPHMYDQKYLCLFWPVADEWRPSMRVAKTIVPWATEWLYFYEMWHATGEWLGGGIHPRRRE